MLFANCFLTDCNCSKVPAAALFAFRDVARPVGKLENLGTGQSGNLPADVRTVQELLNMVPTTEAGQMQPDGSKGLEEDGLIGPLTRGAIHDFQEKQFPDRTPDTVVEHSKATIHRLNQLALPTVDKELQEKGRASIAEAARYIVQGHQAVSMAVLQRGLPISQFRNPKVERLLNYHFHIDKSTDASRDLRFVQETLFTMMTASAHIPLGPNQHSTYGFIDTQPLSNQKDPFFAFTFGGGFKFLQGKTVGDLESQLGLSRDRLLGPETRVDQIYLTRRLINGAPGIIVYALIHELAHFCGGVFGDIDTIDDKAKLDRQKAKYEALSCFDAITNADCYSQFCWELQHGVTFRP